MNEEEFNDKRGEVMTTLAKIKVWILEASRTNYGYGEDTYDVEGVYANKELADRAALDYMARYPEGDTWISEHEVQGGP